MATGLCSFRGCSLLRAARAPPRACQAMMMSLLHQHEHQHQHQHQKGKQACGQQGDHNLLSGPRVEPQVATCDTRISQEHAARASREAPQASQPKLMLHLGPAWRRLCR
jgi:hypothetical protein